MKVHYLEIVSHDVDAVCNAYEIAHSVSFSPHFSRTFRETDFLDCGPQGELNHSVLEPYDVIFHT